MKEAAKKFEIYKEKKRAEGWKVVCSVSKKTKQQNRKTILQAAISIDEFCLKMFDNDRRRVAKYQSGLPRKKKKAFKKLNPFDQLFWPKHTTLYSA